MGASAVNADAIAAGRAIAEPALKSSAILHCQIATAGNADTHETGIGRIITAFADNGQPIHRQAAAAIEFHQGSRAAGCGAR